MTDSIDAPSLATLTDYEGTTFGVDGTDGVDIRLDEVERRALDDDWERFSLWFTSDDELSQDQYRLTDPHGEAFEMTVAPTRRFDGSPDTQTYEAVFSRPASDAEITDPKAALDAGNHLANSPTESQSLTHPSVFVTGQLMLFSGKFAVEGFYECSGVPLNISQHSVLYSIIGTTYGGDGRVRYRLPNLGGRVPLHRDQQHQIGVAGGTESVTLTQNQLASHNHYATNIDLHVSEAEGTEQDPSGNVLTTDPHGGGRDTKTIYADPSESAGAMQVDGFTDDTGRGDEHTNMQPYLSVNYQICTAGIYPTR